jgi:hypothetical protein
MPRARTAQAIACLMAGLASFAHGDETKSARRHASIYAGFEFGESNSLRLEAGGSAYPNEHWRVSAAFARSEFDLPGIDSASTVASARTSYDFGDFGLGGGVRRAELDDVSVTKGLLLNGFVERGEWRFSGEIEARDTDLAAAEFTDEEIPDLGMVSGIASCGIASVGIQAQASLTRKRWSAFGTLKVFEYDDFDCTVVIDGGEGDPDEPGGRDAERRLAENTLDIVTGFGPRLIPREATLLQSSLALGVSVSINSDWLGGAEIYRDVERTGDDVFLTALVFANRPVTNAMTVEFWLGLAKASIEDSAFLGVRLTVDL